MFDIANNTVMFFIHIKITYLNPIAMNYVRQYNKYKLYSTGLNNVLEPFMSRKKQYQYFTYLPNKKYTIYGAHGYNYF